MKYSETGKNSFILKLFFTAAICMMLLITGCQKFRKPETVGSVGSVGSIDSVGFIGSAGSQVKHYVAGFSLENRPIEYSVIGEGDDIILILSAIHGDEKGGIFLADYLLKFLESYPEVLEKRKVVIIPVANPDGEANNSRYNACGVDLNRNFFASNRINNISFGNSGCSEPETKAVHKIIWNYFPARIISIHEGDNIECIDYDGPGEMLAERMASYCDLRVQKLGAKPGSLGSYAGEALKIPVITLELPKNISYTVTPEDLWNLYGNTLIASILYPDYPEDYSSVQIKAIKFSDKNKDNTNISDFP